MSLPVNCACGASLDPAAGDTYCPACGRAFAPRAPARRRWPVVAAAGAIVAGFAGVLVPAVDRVREAAARAD